ncbi:MAG TPA: TadE family protein [Mycobacteriales bacterium]|nr:TadE family protein [Mycobacteriales bacterium]
MQGRWVRGRRDRGAAVVEFALVSVLLTVLFLGLVQVGLAVHVRNTLVACAAEGARHGALADRSPADGAAYAADLIRGSLSPRFARDVHARVTMVEGQPVVEVTVRAPLPVIGLLGPRRTLAVRGHAMVEGEEVEGEG